MPQIPESDIVNALIKKWQTAVAPLRTQNHAPLEEKMLDQFDAEKGKHHLHHQTDLYDKNANLIMDFIAASVPDIIKDLLVGKELGKNAFTRKAYTGKLALSLLARCGKYINNAYVYLDYDTCVPHITSSNLYKKMQWLEWLLLKGKEMLNANKDPNYNDLKVEIIKYIETRLGNAEKNIPGLTMRLNDYAKQHGLKQHTPLELEAEFDAQQAIQKEKRHDEDKGVIMNANGKHLPIIAAPLPQQGLNQLPEDEKEGAIPPALNDNRNPDDNAHKDKALKEEKAADGDLLLDPNKPNANRNPPPIIVAPLRAEQPNQMDKKEEVIPPAINGKENPDVNGHEKQKVAEGKLLIDPNKAANDLLPHQNVQQENIIKPLKRKMGQRIHKDASPFEIALNYYHQLNTMLEPTLIGIKPHLATFMAGFLLNVISTETDSSEENTDTFSTIRTMLFLSFVSYLIYQSYKTTLEPTIIKEPAITIVDEPIGIKPPEDDKRNNPIIDNNAVIAAPLPLVLINPVHAQPEENPVPAVVPGQPNDNVNQPPQPLLAPVENPDDNINHPVNPPDDNANQPPQQPPAPVVNADNNNINQPANPPVELAQPNGKPQMNGNGHLPMDEKLADPIAVEKANFIQELKDFIALQADNIAKHSNSMWGYMLFLTPKDKKHAAEDLLFIMTGRPAFLSEKTIKICKSDPDLKKILEKYEEKFILPSQLINPDKIKSTKGRFIEDLEKYINDRHKKFLASHREYDTIFGSDLGAITGFDAPTKTRSATKLKLLLEGFTEYNGKKIEFDESEIGALSDGALNKIIKKHGHSVSLPTLPKTNGIATNSIPAEQRPKGRN